MATPISRKRKRCPDPNKDFDAWLAYAAELQEQGVSGVTLLRRLKVKVAGIDNTILYEAPRRKSKS